MQEAPVITQTPAPAPAPAPPALPGQAVTTAPSQAPTFRMPTRPLTSREAQVIRERRQEMSNQLQSAEQRRNRLVQQLEDAEGPVRAGLEQRITLLDQRILQIERDIAETGLQLTMLPRVGALTTTTAPPPDFGGLNPGQVTGIAIVGMIFVLFPLVVVFGVKLLRRGKAAEIPPVVAESAQRMERLEQAVDAIAIEIERVSEGQRFVTRLLTEGSASMLSVGQQPAEPVPLRHRDAAESSRDSA